MPTYKYQSTYLSIYFYDVSYGTDIDFRYRYDWCLTTTPTLFQSESINFEWWNLLMLCAVETAIAGCDSMHDLQFYRPTSHHLGHAAHHIKEKEYIIISSRLQAMFLIKILRLFKVRLLVFLYTTGSEYQV